MKWTAAITICFLVLPAASQPPDANLLANPGFETASGDAPAGWSTHIWQGEGRFEYSGDGRAEGRAGGGRCLSITSDTGGDLSWRQDVPVDPDSVYLLTGWIRTEDLRAGSGVGALLNVHEVPGSRTNAVTGTQGWTPVRSRVKTGDRTLISVNCLLGGWGLSTGRAWFDDIRLEKLMFDQLEPEALIDTGDVGQPISPYVYGQFIEHLGRCIYGGLWAEMLEDRKFFFPITADFAPFGSGDPGPDQLFPPLAASPWRIVGPADAVSVSNDEPFAHRRVVEVAPARRSCGIEQPGLGLIADREYVGRVVARNLESPVSSRSIPVEIALVWGPGPEDRQSVTIHATPAFAAHEFRFTAGADSDDASLRITGTDPFQIAAVSLMPADNIEGFRADTLALLRQLNAPIYRWPGGNFVSGYDWRDGIGDPDQRPTRRNPAWTGIETNDVGLHEFLTLCRLIDAEPLIVVNTGFGDAASAAAEVEYVNGAADTPMGGVRAGNGRAEPWNVTWWGIGNEMYGPWQLGHMSLDQYVRKHNDTVDRMRRVDPTIRPVAVGATGDWSETMLRRCADRMDLLSEHFYIGERSSVPEHVAQMPAAVRHKAEAHRRYLAAIPELTDRPVLIALDEWNYWYGPQVYGEIGTRYFLKDALGVAAGLHEMFRNSDIFAMANYAQTVNVIGCIKTSKTDAAMAATGQPLSLYRARFGTLPVRVTGNFDLFDLDIAAAWTEDRTALTIGVVNPHDESRHVAVDLRGTRLAAEGTVWIISGDDPLAFNAPGQRQGVFIREDGAIWADLLTVPALSASLFRFPAADADE